MHLNQVEPKFKLSEMHSCNVILTGLEIIPHTENQTDISVMLPQEIMHFILLSYMVIRFVRIKKKEKTFFHLLAITASAAGPHRVTSHTASRLKLTAADC